MTGPQEAVNLPKVLGGLRCRDCRGYMEYLGDPQPTNSGFNVAVVVCRQCRTAFGVKEQTVPAVVVDYDEAMAVFTESQKAGQ